MPALAGVLVAGFAGTVELLALYVTKKVAIAVALGGFFVAGWVAMELTIKGLFTAIAYSVPGWMVAPLGVVAYLLPSNVDGCLSACMSALFVRWVWDAQREWARAVATV